MGPEQFLKGLGFGLAELGEASGGVSDGAVMLAQLRTGICLHRRRGVTVIGESRCQDCQACPGIGYPRERRGVSRDQLARPLASEIEHRIAAVGGLQIRECGHGEIVIVQVKGMAAGISERENSGRSSAATGRRGPERTLFICLDDPLPDECIEVASHDGGAVPKLRGELRGGGRTTVEEASSHALRARAGEFHTPSVSQISASATPGCRGGPRLRETAAVDAARLRGVEVEFAHGRRALDGLDLRVPAGQVSVLLGPNGAGKSTAVAVMAGLIRPDMGRVEILGGPPGRREARQRLHVMIQDDGLPTGAHAAEMVRHIARLRGDEASAAPLIELYGLEHLGRTTIRRLSGGERRRVSLACALVGRPDMVILDEPTAGLDPRGRALVWESIAELRTRGCTVLLCTHLLDEAEALGDDIAIMAQGRCQVQGSLAQLLPRGGDAVTFDGPLHLDLEGLLLALPEGARAQELSPGRYRIEGAATPQVLATVASWCAQHGVQPRNLGLGSETLSDLYWRLTSTEPDGSPPDPESPPC